MKIADLEMAFRFSKRTTTSSLRRFILRVAAILLGSFILVSLGRVFAQSAQRTVNNNEDFVITAAGDSIIMLPVNRDKENPRFLGVVNTIREGDAAFTNVEEVFPADTTSAGAHSSNTYMGAPGIVMKSLTWMGFNLFGASNNHGNDYGQQGMLDTMKVFQDEGVTYAGMGTTLTKARAAAYLDTARGRVALISTASSMWEDAAAGDPRGDRPGRVGLNPLRFNTVFRIDQATWDELNNLNGRPGITNQLETPSGGHQAGLWGTQLAENVALKKGTMRFAGRTYELSDKPGVYTSFNAQDLAGITRSIRDGKARADYVVTGIHTHESGDGGLFTPPQFLEQFARAAVDAGCDVFVGHGPHVLRGIEIYKGKVIFYSLGAFFFQNDLTPTQPTEEYNRFEMKDDARPSELFGLRSTGPGGNQTTEFWQSAIARVAFSKGHPTQVVLTPIAIRKKEGGLPRYGVPEIADPVLGAKILNDLVRLSRPYGTVITIRDGKGYIDIPQTPN